MRLTKTEELYVRSMGKALRVTAIFDNDNDANAFMAKDDRQAVVCVLASGLILLADKHDRGTAIGQSAWSGPAPHRRNRRSVRPPSEQPPAAQAVSQAEPE